MQYADADYETFCTPPLMLERTIRTLAKMPLHRDTRMNTYYTVSQKNKTLNFCPQLCQMLPDCHKSFANRLSVKFATNSYLNTPEH